MVITFESVSGELRRVAEHDTMHQAAKPLPDGAYTTFRTYGGRRVLRLWQHVRRLEESVGLMGRPAALGEADVRRAVAETLARTRYAESRLRLTFAPPRLFVSIEPFTPYPPSLYASGVWCVTVPLHRDNPHAKSTAFGLAAGAAYAGLPMGAHEGLMLSDDGAILEGLSSNFFAVVAGPAGGAPVLRTEEAQVLIGVTRSIVIELARGVADVSTEALRTAELPAARECFITSVSRQVLPVVKIDDVLIGDGAPGPVTRELMRRFEALVDKEAEG